MAESHGGAKGPAAGAHTEADGGHHGGGFPPFESSTFASQLVSLAIFFVALYVIVSKLALPRVGGAIEARQNKIEGDLAEAQKLKDQSDAALKAYEGELASARSRAQAIGNEIPRQGECAGGSRAQGAGRAAGGQARRGGKDHRLDPHDGHEQRPRHRGRCGRPDRAAAHRRRSGRSVGQCRR